jgi:hypothetical protein
VHTEIAFNSTAVCSTTYCDKVAGLVTIAKQCGKPSQCHCDPVQGCLCTSQSNSTFYLIHFNTFIVFANITPTQAGIGAGVIAAIVIAIVVAAVVLSFSGKKAYDYYVQQKDPTNKLQDNPLYVPNSNSVTNPIYTFEEDEI